MTARILLGLLVVALLAPSASAQTPPSESRIRADVLAQVEPAATSVALRGNGSRQLNGGVWEFIHSITTRKPYAEIDGVEIESYGDVVYQSHGSTYQYDRYRVGDWRYFGIPDPSAEEIEAVVMTDQASVYPHRTLDADRELTVLADEETYWHNPTSVTLKVAARYRAIVSNTVVSDNEGVFEIRLYREAFDGPWTRFTTVGREVTETGRETLLATEVAEMLTLKDAAAIAEYAAHAATLPEVQVPEFRSGMELAVFLYNAFRETTDRATREATIRAVLPTAEFFPGTRAVGLKAQMWLDRVLDSMEGGSTSFAEQTCASPMINENPSTRETDRIYIHSLLTVPPRGTALGAMMVRPMQESTGYRNGEPVPGRWTLTPVQNESLGGLTANVSSDPDDLAWLRSFDDPSSLCTATGQATQAATQDAQDAAGQATGDAQGAVEGAVREGRRRLGRLLGRGN